MGVSSLFVMKNVFLFFVVLLCSFAVGEELLYTAESLNGTEVLFFIDSFTEGTWQHVEYIPQAQSSTSNYYSQSACDSIIGCSRSMIMNSTDTSSTSFSVILPHVHFREPGMCVLFPVANQVTKFILQYDGDADPEHLNTTGLAGFDFTANNKAGAILFSTLSGYQPGTLQFGFYDTQGGYCEATASSVENHEDCHHFLPVAVLFSEISGDCALNSLGALEIIYSSDEEYTGSLALGQIFVTPPPPPNTWPEPRC